MSQMITDRARNIHAVKGDMVVHLIEAVGALAVVIAETQQSTAICLGGEELDAGDPIVVGTSLGPDSRGATDGDFKHRHIGPILRPDSVTFCGEQIES